MKKKIKKHKFLCIFLLFQICFIVLGLFKPLSVSRYEYHNKKLPDKFNGLKIVQLSDFHCKDFGTKENKLISSVAKCSPDIIFFTGDMVDEIHSTDNLKYLLDGLSSIAPIYAVLGNHDDIDPSVYSSMLDLFTFYNVTILDGESTYIKKGNQQISISGCSFLDWAGNCIKAPDYNENNKEDGSSNIFNILLFHDSNAFPTVSTYGYQMVFSGHTHGGIVRLPFIGGLIGTRREFHPQYAGGEFINKDTDCTMYSSRGLGDTVIPRFYNPPEIVEVTLYSN